MKDLFIQKAASEFDGLTRFMVIGVGEDGQSAIRFLVDNNVTEATLVSYEPSAEVPNEAFNIDESMVEWSSKQHYLDIAQILDGIDMVFIVENMGNWSNETVRIAEIAREKGISVVSLVVYPHRQINANLDDINFQKTVSVVDFITKIQRQKPRGDDIKIYFNETLDRKTTNMVNCQVLFIIRSFTDLIIHPSMINVDFFDIQYVINGTGYGEVCFGRAEGENRAIAAIEQAIGHLKTNKLIVRITSSDLSCDEFFKIGTWIESHFDDVTPFIDMEFNPSMQDTLEVRVIASGVHIEPHQINQENPI